MNRKELYRRLACDYVEHICGDEYRAFIDKARTINALSEVEFRNIKQELMWLEQAKIDEASSSYELMIHDHGRAASIHAVSALFNYDDRTVLNDVITACLAAAQNPKEELKWQTQHQSRVLKGLDGVF